MPETLPAAFVFHRAEHRPRRHAARGAVATDRPVTALPARVGTSDALPVALGPHAFDRRTQFFFDGGKIVVVVELPRLGVVVDLGLQIFVTQTQPQTALLRSRAENER